MEYNLLFSHKIIFGPVKSRRLGLSLGVNLMPHDAKVCSFDCVYCECGLNEEKEGRIPSRKEVRLALEKRLSELKEQNIIPDVITFSGNGEPSLHKEFEKIIDDTLVLRDEYMPSAKVTVLSNSTRIDRSSVFRALCKVDNNILKFDSAINETLLAINQPNISSFSVQWLMKHLKKFEGKLLIQTIFIRGEYKGKPFDNTTDAEVSAWISALKEIRPQKVMIYALDRPAPISSVEKVSLEELNTIALRLKEEGFDVIVAG
jgi:wyosine [tRNA(Phe)-imidazoG37] synthetase (radical SAM superfamily)